MGARQHDPVAEALLDRDDRLDNGRLPRAGSAGDDHHFPLHRISHRQGLLLRKGKAEVLLGGRDEGVSVDQGQLPRITQQVPQAARKPLLGYVEPRQVDRSLFGVRASCGLNHDAAVGGGRGDRVEDHAAVGLKRFFTMVYKKAEGVVDMPLFGELVEQVLDPCPRPGGRVFRDPQFLRDLVRRDKTDAEDVLGEPVRVFTDYRDSLSAVMLEYLYRIGGADAVSLQEDHYIPYLLLSLPGAPYHPDPFFPYAVDLGQPLYVPVDHVEGLYREFRDQPFCRHGADAFDHAGAQIALYAGDSGGHHHFAGGCLELPAVPRMVLPFALQLHRLPGVQARNAANDRHETGRPFRLHLGDGIAVLLVKIGDPLYLSLQFDHDGRLVIV